MHSASFKRAIRAAFAAILVASAASAVRAQENDPPAGGGVIILRNGGDQKVISIDPRQLKDISGGIVMVAVSGNGEFSAITGSPADMPFGGMLGPFGMGGGLAGIGKGLNIVDPGVSYIFQLIKRSDVRSELFLDPKQREKLEQMFNEESAAAQQRANALKDSLKSGGASVGSAQKATQFFGPNASDREKKLAEILTPKQLKRLKELDLQYRGPLAMGVKPVAEKAKLTETEAPAVADLLQKYHEAVRKALGFEQKVQRTENGNGNTSVSISTSVNITGSQQELEQKAQKAQEVIDAARKALGAQALKSIASDHALEWKGLAGPRFQFQSLLN